MKCQICGEEQDKKGYLKIRNLTLRYCNLKVSIPVCFVCLCHNSRELLSEIDEKAINRFIVEGADQ